MDKLWSFTRRIEIPLRHVRTASFDSRVMDGPKGLRWPGLRLPGKVAGTFYYDKTRQFWNVTGHHRTIVITLDGAERFDRLILTVGDPLREVDKIKHALASRT